MNVNHLGRGGEQASCFLGFSDSSQPVLNSTSLPWLRTPASSVWPFTPFKILICIKQSRPPLADGWKEWRGKCRAISRQRRCQRESERERTSEGSHAISSIGDYSSSLPPRRHHNVYHLLTAAKVFESWLENIEPKIFDGRGECI